jgi:hypothetical protein
VTGERIALGDGGEYKPMITPLPGGELLMVAFRGQACSEKAPDGRTLRHEEIIAARSTDGGKRWSPFAPIPHLLGREAYITLLSDGTLLMTAQLLHYELRNFDGWRPQSLLHRSTDGGRTWQSRHIVPEEYPPHWWIHSSRNVVELRDGTVLMAVSGERGAPDLIYRSSDKGMTWSHERTQVVGKPASCPHPFFAEAWFWLTSSGRLLAIARVSQDTWTSGWPANAPRSSDQFERMIVLSCDGDARTWKFESDLGGVGMMYPSLLRLGSGRLLLTYTYRAGKPPLGVRAVLGLETPDGFEFDFTREMILDDQTPPQLSSGGGFGNTIKLDDGALLTPYSYRVQGPVDRDTRIEVLRWRLP